MARHGDGIQQLQTKAHTKKRADWPENWLREVVIAGSVVARDTSQGLGRLGFAAIALDWERPFLGPL